MPHSKISQLQLYCDGVFDHKCNHVEIEAYIPWHSYIYWLLPLNAHEEFLAIQQVSLTLSVSREWSLAEYNAKQSSFSFCSSSKSLLLLLASSLLKQITTKDIINIKYDSTYQLHQNSFQLKVRKGQWLPPTSIWKWRHRKRSCPNLNRF